MTLQGPMPDQTIEPGKQGRAINEIDAHVAKQILSYRELLGISQQHLARCLGLSFQQVQKYERGINRVSAGRLFQIAACFGIRVESLFEGIPSSGNHRDISLLGGQERVLTFAATQEGSILNEAYLDSASPRQRKIALEILRLPLAPAPSPHESVMSEKAKETDPKDSYRP